MLLLSFQIQSYYRVLAFGISISIRFMAAGRSVLLMEQRTSLIKGIIYLLLTSIVLENGLDKLLDEIYHNVSHLVYVSNCSLQDIIYNYFT